MAGEEWHADIAEFQGFTKAKLENIERAININNRYNEGLQKRVTESEKSIVKLRVLVGVITLAYAPGGLSALYKLAM